MISMTTWELQLKDLSLLMTQWTQRTQCWPAPLVTMRSSSRTHSRSNVCLKRRRNALETATWTTAKCLKSNPRSTATSSRSALKSVAKYSATTRTLRRSVNFAPEPERIILARTFKTKWCWLKRSIAQALKMRASLRRRARRRHRLATPTLIDSMTSSSC